MLLEHYFTVPPILSSQVVSLPLQSIMEVANFCAAMDTLIDQDVCLLNSKTDACFYKPSQSQCFAYLRYDCSETFTHP